jgi:hypothetical protein
MPVTPTFEVVLVARLVAWLTIEGLEGEYIQLEQSGGVIN